MDENIEEEGTTIPETGAGTGDEAKEPTENGTKETGNARAGEQNAMEPEEISANRRLEEVEGGNLEVKHLEGEHLEGEHLEGEHLEGVHLEVEHLEGEHLEGEHLEREHLEGEHLEGEHLEREYLEGENVEDEQNEKVLVEGEELMGEEVIAEEIGEEHGEGENIEDDKPPQEEGVEEEEGYVEEPPPDPAAPFDFSDSKELLKEPFELRPDQIAEVEQLWELYQNYTPAYTDIDGYITEKELIYMLKCLMLMTYTPEQLQELIEYCVRPPHPEGHITYDQFLKMVRLRQREYATEDELRSALQVYDPDRTGTVDREYLKEVLAKQGHKMPQKQLDNLIKEVDISNDGTIGIEDVVGTMCIDLNKEDLQMLLASIYPEEHLPPPPEDI